MGEGVLVGEVPNWSAGWRVTDSPKLCQKTNDIRVSNEESPVCKGTSSTLFFGIISCAGMIIICNSVILFCLVDKCGIQS